MNILGSIFSKLDIQEAVEKPAETPAPAPGSVSSVDVVSTLEKLAAAQPEKLNWKVSIADLLTLLGIESSYAARKELAGELGCPEDKMTDSAQMNMWLHQTVLQKIADNGGNIPTELLDQPAQKSIGKSSSQIQI